MNKKTQILCLFLIGISFLSNESKAIPNEDLFKACKRYTESGFKITTIQHTLCMSYMRGVIDTASLLCHSAGLIDEKDASFWLKAFGTETGGHTQLDAIIQSYVNHMAANPKDWKGTAPMDIIKLARNFVPCK
jgi:hypothetical protein